MICPGTKENIMNEISKNAFERHQKIVSEVASAIVGTPRQRGKFHTVTAECSPWWVACEVAKHMGPPVWRRGDHEFGYQFSCCFEWEPDFAIQVLPLSHTDRRWRFCFG